MRYPHGAIGIQIMICHLMLIGIYWKYMGLSGNIYLYKNLSYNVLGFINAIKYYWCLWIWEIIE